MAGRLPVESAFIENSVSGLLPHPLPTTPRNVYRCPTIVDNRPGSLRDKPLAFV